MTSIMSGAFLTLQQIANPKQQQELLAEFNPDQATWVVSDLKSKLDLQRRLLTTREFLHGESILRASELWKILLTRLRPDIQIISREFATTLVAEELARREEPWAQSPGAAQMAYQYLSQLMPILSHPQGAEIMQEWFGQHPASQIRWGRWFDLCQQLWKTFLEKGLNAAPWVSGVLVNELGFEQVWNKPLIFDLGAEMNQVEADLIAILANFVPITVIEPHPSWGSEYKRTLLPYEILEKKPKATRVPFSGKSRAKKESNTDLGIREYKKFTTMLAEVKHAVATSREWLEQGVSPSSIAIGAPDIEVYWPALSPYLEQEGIPCQKSRVARAHTFPDVSQWLSTLRLRVGGFDEADLEVSLFDQSIDQTRSPILSYENFRVLYSALYMREDLERDDHIAKLYQIDLRPDQIVERDPFVAWALKALPENADRSRIEALFKKLFDECPESTELRTHRWMGYLEEIATKTEIRVKEGQADGISCINLESCENSPSTHMLLLGLTESALRTGAETAILFADIMSLSAAYGFHLQSQDLAKLEFEARWVIENSSRHLILCVPETDFGGAVQAPAWLWVKAATETEVSGEISLPSTTRWDQIQRAPVNLISEYRGWASERSALLQKSLGNDLGIEPLPHYAVGRVSEISASSIEDYLTCPFIFAAKRLFRLSDDAVLDLDVDASTRGKLMHGLFEKLTAEPMRFEWTAEELETVVEAARSENDVQIYDERFWPSVRTRYIELAKRFLAFEKEWRARFPETKTVGREVKVDGYVDPKTGAFQREKADGYFHFRGRIDRVDMDKSGHAAIIDYKSSASKLSQWGSWVKNRELQLILYSLALSSGLTELSASEIVSAVYYVASNLDRDYGFKVSDVDQGLYSIEGKKRNKVAGVEREKLFGEAQALARQALEMIRDGRFAPQPADFKTCDTCRWSSVCRAPHLNT